MRLIIEFDEKHQHLFYQLITATQATIIEEPDFWTTLPEYVKAGIKKGQEQARSGQTKTYKEVKKILAERFPKN